MATRRKKAPVRQKAKCTTTSRAGNCIVYEKHHTDPKAAIGHIKKIRKRGGKIVLKRPGKGKEVTLQYAFPKAKK